ncbi:hypothetical protein M0R45_015017 [Rubus argutus]|uniref:Reverse transcriptase n=1 Tax=Rubus argutus TaxID=59490 RepID=A0AAW1XRP4_RUBAR
MADRLGVAVVDSHEKYLGLPTFVGREKTATFQYIKDRLSEKLKGWQRKLLSGVGKDILIRVVAQALPTYEISCFQLTKNFCDDLQQMCARFWWSSSENKKKIHWKAWKDLCYSKEEGGLEFRNLAAFNLAMLAKQAWRVISNPESLIARIFKARYFPYGSFWTADLQTSPSYSWRSILASRELLLKGSRWLIGNGANVFIWSSNWIPRVPSTRPSANLTGMNNLARVQELILYARVWNEDFIRGIFIPSDAEVILSIPLRYSSPPDRLVWHPERKGIFSVKTAYRLELSSTQAASPTPFGSNASIF